MTGVVVGFTAGLATVAVLGWLKRWSDREALRVQARTLAAWEARQCPDRVDDLRDVDLEFAKIIDHWQDT